MPNCSTHILVKRAEALIYFTGIEIALLSAQPCICSLLVPHQLGTDSSVNALTCVCLG